MQTTFAVLAALASVAITPAAAAPADCVSTYSGKFEITAYNLSSVVKRDLEKRTCDAEGSLTITLADGILTDAKGRIGYIASNHQFQFDGPVQAGALSRSGWSVCSNGSLALGGSNVFYQCISGNPDGSASGSFYNLYDDKAFDICSPAAINALPCGTSGSVGQLTDGQPTGAAATPAPVTQISDGQPQAGSGLPLPITQISDGQIQIPTAEPLPITQISDGQIQIPTAEPLPITQIPDGQIQYPTATVAPAPITQITDGQIQAPTSTAAPLPITQITDGQIQAPTSTAAPLPITQIPDGQVQAPSGTGSSYTNATTSSTIPFTGSASTLKAGAFSVFLGVVAVALL